MLVFGLCILLLYMGVSTGIPMNNSYEDLNSHISFANKIQEFLNSDYNTRISFQCSAHLWQYAGSLLRGRDEDFWAVKMFDAGAKLPAGVLAGGNGADLGSFDECINIEETFLLTKEIRGKYCLGTIPIDLEKIKNKKSFLLNKQISGLTGQEPRLLALSGIVGIQLATCLPDSCSTAEIQKLYRFVGMVFFDELCQTKESQPKLDGGSIATISFLAAILWVMLISTAYDVVLCYYDRKSPYPMFIAFSILTNGKKILSTKGGPNQISCLHGIRVISTMWVILGHKYSIQNWFPASNNFDILKWMKNQANMFVMGATVSVDTFFLIAGLVIAYSYMCAMTKGIKFNIIMYYIHRYLRLTPVLAVVMVIHITLLRHLGSGPIWPYVVELDLIVGCEKNWWKTLLYVQNYGNQNLWCIPQSWYLSVDTQLFVLAPLLLIPLRRWPTFTLSLTGFLTACSITTCFLTGWFFELNYNIVGNFFTGNLADYFYYYYRATQTRAAPWLIGIMLGYLIFIFKQRTTKLVINKAVIIGMWITSLAILCTCVYAAHDLIFDDNRLANSFHLALVRPAWAVALSFIIFACVIGYGGPVNRFLSLPVFQILSKLTYTMYLVHYTMIYLTTAQMRTTPRFSNASSLYSFWGDFVFTLIVSLVLTLAFESPIITIEKVLFEGTKKKPRPAQGADGRAKSVESA